MNFAAHFLVADGYGTLAEYTVLGMDRAGARVNLLPIKVFPEGLAPRTLELLQASTPYDSGPVVFSAALEPALELYAASEHFVHTMWESSRLPADWPERLNRASAVIVPTRFVADVCRASGVVSPIEVVPEGVDPAVYPWLDRSGRESLTTLIVGTVLPRKHIAEGIEAWRETFGDDPRARLIVKSRFQTARAFGLASDDPRITVVDDPEMSRGILHWYEQADVLLALGSEGFGLPLVEGMATGLPVIVLSSEGQGDVCRDASGLVLDVPASRWEEAVEPVYGDCGVRGVPDVADVVARLRWVTEHREEARQLGVEASRWVHTNRDVWQKGPALLEVIEHHAGRERTFRS